MKNELVTFFKSTHSIIKNELNHGVRTSTIMQNLSREINSGFYSNADNLYFSDFCKEDRLGLFVDVGKIWESILMCHLKNHSNMNITAYRSNVGDLKINNQIYETKATFNVDGWTGSTHSLKKEETNINFIGLSYDIDKTCTMNDFINGNKILINGLFLIVIDDFSFIRTAHDSPSNSRSSLQIAIEDYDDVQDGVVFGGLTKKKKYCYFEYE